MKTHRSKFLNIFYNSRSFGLKVCHMIYWSHAIDLRSDLCQWTMFIMSEHCSEHFIHFDDKVSNRNDFLNFMCAIQSLVLADRKAEKWKRKVKFLYEKNDLNVLSHSPTNWNKRLCSTKRMIRALWLVEYSSTLVLQDTLPQETSQ